MAGVHDRLLRQGEQLGADRSMMVPKSEYDRPVAPGPPANRVSPLKTAPSSAYRQVPGECPGVDARSVLPAISKVLPSTSRDRGAVSCSTSHNIRSDGTRSVRWCRAAPPPR